MRHPYFHKAVTICYEHLIPVGEMPNYFINLTVDPETIDVNIHPTKTEIKFENEQPIWQILSASVKEALGKFSTAPSIDFDMEDAPEIPTSKPGTHVLPPTVHVDTTYNPFRATIFRLNWISLMDMFLIFLVKGNNRFFLSSSRN